MESTLKRTWAEIDLDALAHNYGRLRQHIGPKVRFLGVVKADAYGHGAVQVARTLQELGADYLAVSSIDEAMELRANGVTMPVLILGHTPKEQVGRLIEHHITQAVTCKAKALEYSREAAALGGTLKTTISTTKTYEPGTSVSYGRLFTTRRRTRMGVVPYGYADGFFRCLSDRCSLMTAKGPAPQRGRICMDMSMIDLTDLPGVDVGDEVEIFGPHNPVEVMAAQAGTIPYELTCAVSKRVPRVYLQNGQVTERELLLRF